MPVLRQPLFIVVSVIALLAIAVAATFYFQGARTRATLREEIASLAGSTQSRDAELAALRASAGTLEDVEAQVTQAQAELATAREGVEAARAEEENARSRVADLSEEAEGLTGQVETLRQELATAQQAAQDAQAKAADAQQSLASLQQNRDALTGSVDELSRRNESLSATLAEAERTLSGRQVEQQEVAATLEGIRAEVERMTVARATLEQEAAALADQNKRLADEVAAAQNALATSQAQVVTAEGREDTLQQEVDTLSGSRDEAAARLAALETENEELRGRVGEVEAQRGALEGEVATLRGERDRLTAAAGEAAQQAEALEAEVASLRARPAAPAAAPDMAATVAALTESRAALDRAIAALGGAPAAAAAPPAAASGAAPSLRGTWSGEAGSVPFGTATFAFTAADGTVTSGRYSFDGTTLALSPSGGAALSCTASAADTLTLGEGCGALSGATLSRGATAAAPAATPALRGTFGGEAGTLRLGASTYRFAAADGTQSSGRFAFDGQTLTLTPSGATATCTAAVRDGALAFADGCGPLAGATLASTSRPAAPAGSPRLRGSFETDAGTLRFGAATWGLARPDGSTAAGRYSFDGTTATLTAGDATCTATIATGDVTLGAGCEALAALTAPAPAPAAAPAAEAGAPTAEVSLRGTYRGDAGTLRFGTATFGLVAPDGTLTSGRYAYDGTTLALTPAAGEATVCAASAADGRLTFGDDCGALAGAAFAAGADAAAAAPAGPPLRGLWRGDAGSLRLGTATFALTAPDGSVASGRYSFDGSTLTLSDVAGAAAGAFPLTCAVAADGRTLSLSGEGCGTLAGASLSRVRPASATPLRGTFASERLSVRFGANTFRLAVTNGATVAGRYSFADGLLRLSGVTGRAAGGFPLTCRATLDGDTLRLAAYQGSCLALNGAALARQD